MRALELHQQGWIQREIAAALGATESSISQWLASARRGVRRRSPPSSRPTDCRCSPHSATSCGPPGVGTCPEADRGSSAKSRRCADRERVRRRSSISGIRGGEAPDATASENVEDRVDEGATADRPGRPSSRGRRQEFAQDLPWLVGRRRGIVRRSRVGHRYGSFGSLPGIEGRSYRFLIGLRNSKTRCKAVAVLPVG